MSGEYFIKSFLPGTLSKRFFFIEFYFLSILSVDMCRWLRWPPESRRGFWSQCSWSYRIVRPTFWVLGTKLRFHGRAIHADKHWDISPAPRLWSSLSLPNIDHVTGQNFLCSAIINHWPINSLFWVMWLHGFGTPPKKSIILSYYVECCHFIEI